MTYVRVILENVKNNKFKKNINSDHNAGEWLLSSKINGIYP